MLDGLSLTEHNDEYMLIRAALTKDGWRGLLLGTVDSGGHRYVQVLLG